MSGRISHTAAFISVKFYGLTLKEPVKSLFDPEIVEFYANIVRQLPKHLRWYERALKSKWWRTFFIWTEELLLPGDLMHIIGRKYYMIEAMDKAIKSGINQVVVLGSGFDHSAWKAAKDGLLAIEIDTPLMIGEKKKFLDKGNYQLPNLHLEAIDVNKEDIIDVLKRVPEYDASKPTAFIAEGFFDYLTLETNKEVLSQIKKLSSSPTLITTIFSLDELNFFFRSSFTSGVAMVGEAIKLPLNYRGFVELLEEYDFKVDASISYTQMEQDLFKSQWNKQSVLDGFYILEARQ